MSKEARTCDDCGELTTDFEILIDTIRCRECWDKYIQNGYISQLEQQRDQFRRERDEYLDLMISVFVEHFCSSALDIGVDWLDQIERSLSINMIADVLVKAGRLERHPENKRLYRRIK